MKKKNEIFKKINIIYIITKINLLSFIAKKKAAKKVFEIFCTPYLKAQPRFPAIFHEATPLFFYLNNRKITGFKWNGSQSKKVLILHGFRSAAHKFEHMVSPLIQKGYEVLAFDAPAHGASEGHQTNVLEYSAMIKKIMDLWGPIDSFIAHSFGGIAVCFALEEMDFIDKKKVVLIAPATETKTAIDILFKILKLKSKAVRKEFDKIILETSGKATEWFSIRRAVKNIKADILWIHDEEDYITPLTDALNVKNDDHPHIQFLITKGLGHQKIYRDTDVNNAVLAFL